MAGREPYASKNLYLGPLAADGSHGRMGSTPLLSESGAWGFRVQFYHYAKYWLCSRLTVCLNQGSRGNGHGVSQ